MATMNRVNCELCGTIVWNSTEIQVATDPDVVWTICDQHTDYDAQALHSERRDRDDAARARRPVRWESNGEKHGYSNDLGCCLCGGEWVYLGDDATHGCFEADAPPVILDGSGRPFIQY